MGLRRYVSMDDNKRYRIFKFFLIFTILNVFGIFLYENISGNGLFRKRPEFYIESIKTEHKSEAETSTISTVVSIINEKKQVETEAVKSEKLFERKLLIIGDSNAYIMSRNEEHYKNKYKYKIYWLAESGVGTEFINDELMVKFGELKSQYVKNTLGKTKNIFLLDEIKEKGITDIAVLLGVNSLKDASAKSLCDTLTKLNELSKTDIYYVSVLPYVNKERYKIQNKDIIKFNNIMKEKLSLSKVNYVDAYGLLTETEEYKKETTDGLHYSTMIYDRILDKIMNTLVQNN